MVSFFKLALFICLGTIGLASFELHADTLPTKLPGLTEIQDDFDNAPDENQRYQILDRLSSLTDQIVTEGKESAFIDLMRLLARKSKAKGDASWVIEKASQNVKAIAKAKLGLILNTGSAIPAGENARDELIRYLVLCEEATQHAYFSTNALKFLIENENISLFDGYYTFFQKARSALDPHSAPDYILNDIDYLLQAIGFLYFRNYPSLTFSQLEPWLPRMTPAGIQKLLQNFDDRVVSSSSTDLETVRKIVWASHFFYSFLFDKFKNDPFNDWEYLRVLRTIEGATLRGRRYDWPIELDDSRFLADRLAPSALVDFCEKFGKTVTEAPVLTEETAIQLAPSFQYFFKVLQRQNLANDEFAKGMLRAQTMAMPKNEIEGIYDIDLPEFSTITLAYVNESRLTAGLRGKIDAVNASFDSLNFDPIAKGFVGQTGQRDRLVVLKVNAGGGTVKGCLGSRCFSGKKIETFPDFMAGQKANPTRRDVTGDYRGVIYYSSGKTQEITLSIYFVNGSLIANFAQEKGARLAFPAGLKDFDHGIVYLMSAVSETASLHYLRGEVDEEGVLTGIYFSTNRAVIGNFKLKKQM